MTPRDPVADLRRIAFVLERSLESTHRVKAFRQAAAQLLPLDLDQIAQLSADGTLTDLEGIGQRTATCVAESLSGNIPTYLTQLERQNPAPSAGPGESIRRALRGDCHTHSDWSDGGSPIPDMVMGAIEVGHEYAVLTDHSPSLKVANGLSGERLRRQLEVVAALNEHLDDFTLLTGIEVDVLASGRLDQTDELLAEVDVVVASVHSLLKMPSADMTRRMIAAVMNPHTDILGHCTGRKVKGSWAGGGGGSDRGHAGVRPPSQFDAQAVFKACHSAGVAVEINSRPERLDPPRSLLRLAADIGCLFAINTDAHAPGQLDWQGIGAARAAEAGIPAERIVNTWAREDLLAWTRDHSYRPAQRPAPQPALTSGIVAQRALTQG